MLNEWTVATVIFIFPTKCLESWIENWKNKINLTTDPRAVRFLRTVKHVCLSKAIL